MLFTLRANAQEIKVQDGDSLKIQGQRIRLLGIDAPEYNQKCKDNKQKLYNCGIDSKNHLIKLTNNKEIICNEELKDIYNRSLSICFADDLNINAQMVKDGYAITYLDSEYKQQEEYAKQHKKGIWGGTFIHPRLFRLLKDKRKQQ